MAAGADTRASQVNAEEFEEYFEPFLKAGKISCISHFHLEFQE